MFQLRSVPLATPMLRANSAWEKAGLGADRGYVDFGHRNLMDARACRLALSKVDGFVLPLLDAFKRAPALSPSVSNQNFALAARSACPALVDCLSRSWRA